jgi:hypothetical protein
MVTTTHQSAHNQVPVHPGIKLFVNIAWYVDVSPPPDGVENAVELATHSCQMDLKNGQDTPKQYPSLSPPIGD